jgi:O-antigen ligase
MNDQYVVKIGNQKSVTKVGKSTTFLCSVYIFMSFYENYFSQFSWFSTRYLILILIFSLLINNRMIVLKWYHFTIISWMALLVMSSFWSRDNAIMNLHLVSIIGMVGLFIIMTSANFEAKFVKYLIKTMLFTSASMGVLSIFLSSSYNNVFETRQVLVLNGVDFDPNNLAALLMVGISISLYYIIYKKRFLLHYVLIIIINTYGVAMTGSRGGLVTFVGILLLFAILTEDPNNKIRVSLIKIALLIISFFVAYKLLQVLLPLSIFDRLFSFSNYSGGSGRDLIWKNAWGLFLNFPIFGAGWGAYYGYNGFYVAVHQTYLSMLCDVGILGTLLFFTPILKKLFEALKKRNYFPIIIFATGLLPAIFLDAINKRFFWNAIIISFVILNSNFVERKVTHI